MADVKYKDATPVDEPVARPKQKAKSAPPKDKKPTPPKEQMMHRYEESTGLKPTPVEGLDLTETQSYAKGGSASSRADGCAQRGKTRGMML